MRGAIRGAYLALVLAVAVAWLANVAQAQQGAPAGGGQAGSAGMQLFRENCQLIDQLSATDAADIKAKPEGFVLEVQRGMRSVYTAEDFNRLGVVNPQRFLNDDKFGPQTQRALRALPSPMARVVHGSQPMLR